MEAFDLRRRTPSSHSSQSLRRRQSSRRSTSRSQSSSSRRTVDVLTLDGQERCQDPGCEICQKPMTAIQASDQARLADIGLDVGRYRFSYKATQLDVAIQMLTQSLDERLQNERYRDAKELSQLIRELTDTKREADLLLERRRANIGDLLEAQRLKNEYDRLTWSAVDVEKLRKFLTVAQISNLLTLRRF